MSTLQPGQAPRQNPHLVMTGYEKDDGEYKLYLYVQGSNTGASANAEMRFCTLDLQLSAVDTGPRTNTSYAPGRMVEHGFCWDVVQFEQICLGHPPPPAPNGGWQQNDRETAFKLWRDGLLVQAQNTLGVQWTPAIGYSVLGRM